jgi:indolepyruvate ferredoxin oxidoreductase alpha subunit
MTHPLLNPSAGGTELLLGNEAIVRGLLEAGIAFVSCYPGTPSSEIPDTFHRLKPHGDFYFEYSANEKVALEVGGGAALSGAPTCVTMKHVGVNVAADPLMTLAYIGCPGGLVLVSADDPGCHSSQNEQDNRLFAQLAGLPVFEPSTAQECKDMARDALLFSRERQQPVMLRTTTRVSHLRGPVEFGPLPGATKSYLFEKNPMRWVPIPAVARVRHKELLKFMGECADYAETSPLNTITGSGDVGIVASSIGRAYVKDVLAEDSLADQVSLLELGFSYPMPEKMLTKFLSEHKTVLVVEELEPFVEDALRALAHKHNIDVDIQGKGDHLTRLGELNTEMVRGAVHQALGKTPKAHVLCAPPREEPLPLRPPNLCAGCSHRSAYFTVREVYGDEAVYSNDIGCYTLGILPPLATADFLLCMGSSVSAGGGFAMASGKPVVAFIGDSTFFHSGVTGLVSAVYNKHDLLLVILDNGTTAMTGHQPHPGVETTIHGGNPGRVDIEAVVRGCGVDAFEVMNPANYKASKALIEKMKGQRGVRVILSQEPCILFAKRTLKQKQPRVAYVTEQTQGVQDCLKTLACPAFAVEEEGIIIREDLCTGCMFCLQVCSDIKAKQTA